MALVTKQNLYNARMKKIRAKFQETKNNIMEISDNEYQELLNYGIDNINENHIITYEAPEKLLIVNETSINNPGVQALSFNTEIIDHTYENGIGKIIFKNELTDIKENAFSYCKNITKLYLPNSIKIIENNVFTYCRNLKYIKLPNDLISIGSHCFNNTYELIELEFFNINEFKEYALFETNLNKIILHQLNPPILENKRLGILCPDDLGQKTNIYVPLESLDLYMMDENWNQYGNLIQPIQI